MTDAQMAAAWQLEHDDTPVDSQWLWACGNVTTSGNGVYYVKNDADRVVITLSLESWSKGRVYTWAATLDINSRERIPMRFETRGQVRTLARLMGAELREGTT